MHQVPDFSGIIRFSPFFMCFLMSSDTGFSSNILYLLVCKIPCIRLQWLLRRNYADVGFLGFKTEAEFIDLDPFW